MSIEILTGNIVKGTGYQSANYPEFNLPVNVQVRGWYNPDLVSAY